ncbi:hypothetical protein DEU56DRAFT_102829 [Suillus clintonianus]|uniref:uncharacterized protein n=1 Tax=Suillus clintonianus TaxID=1904413 RepID=UPI001B87CBBD|nr:uncharacterized protein DEU56DRAFT_102829 [Suillus clintonianus]KAG2147955.1 hypothetical protein DEU56DRAFT_102829 [Suillus clintonianus]
MRASIICLVVLLAAATLVSSRPSASYLAQSFRLLSTASYKRQSSGYVPSQCTSTCDPVNNEVNAGCPITTCCTQSFETSYYNCLICVGTALNATDYTQAQADLDQLFVSCFDYGYTLQELTLPGQNPSRTLSTSLLVGSLPTATSTSTLSTSTSPASSGSATSSTPTSAALRLGTGGSGVWALAAAAAAIGLVVL